MPSTDEPSDLGRPPGWALEQATADLFDSKDPAAVTRRAWDLVHEAEEREAERHDEFDDPDQGGEA